MKNKQKGFVVPLVIAIVAVLVAGGIGYVAYEKGKSAQVEQENQQFLASTTTSDNVYTNAVQSNSASTQSQNANTSNPNMIGSTNTTTSVTGMQQYTDSGFGFSFWYPNTWVVQQQTPSQQYIQLSGGTVVKTLVVGPENDPSNSIAIQEFTASGEGITDTSAAGPAGNGSLSLTYFFNPSTHTWMAQHTDGENNTTTYAANVSTNTMGGLHLLGGNARFGDDVIIPLSAENFLVVSSIDAGTIQERLLAMTITATDPSVATPVSQAEQVQTIQVEGLLYGALGTRVGDWYIDNQYVYDSQGNIIPGANPATFKSIDTYSDGYVTTGTGYATDGVNVYSDWSTTNPVLEGADPATFIPIRQEYQIPYAQSSGKYGQSFTSYDTTFAKDKSHVWYEGRLVPGADPSTLVITGGTDIKNSNGGYTLAHDAHHTYGVDTNNNITVDGLAVQ